MTFQANIAALQHGRVLFFFAFSSESAYKQQQINELQSTAILRIAQVIVQQQEYRRDRLTSSTRYMFSKLRWLTRTEQSESPETKYVPNKESWDAIYSAGFSSIHGQVASPPSGSCKGDIAHLIWKRIQYWQQLQGRYSSLNMELS